MSQIDLPIQMAMLSDAGLARESNEDSVKTFTADHLVRVGGRLLLVADGVGGAPHGKLASQLAVDQVGDRYYAHMQAQPTARPAHALKLAIEAANRVIFEQAQNLGAPGQMGAAIAAVVLRPDQLSIAWVGDSRVYLVQGDTGTIQQLTHDHSVVAEQVRQGVLTEEEAAFHPNRTMLTRCLGHGPQVEVDVLAGEVLPGDVVVLCSDGLTRYITEDELAIQVHGSENLNVVARRLVSLANDRGGMDNISVIIARLEGAVDSYQPPVAAEPAQEPGLSAPARTRRQAPPPEVGTATGASTAPLPAEKPVRSRRSKARRSRFPVRLIPIAAIGLLALLAGGFLLVRGIFFPPGPEAPAADVMALTSEALLATLTPTVRPTLPPTPTQPPPTDTPTPTDTPIPSPMPTPVDPNAPRDWAIGAMLYVTEDTGVYASAGGVASSRQLSAGQAVIVVRSGSGATGDYRYQRDGRWWWHVGVDQNGTLRFPGWVPQDVLTDTPPE